MICRVRFHFAKNYTEMECTVNPSRRAFLHLAAGTAAFPAGARLAQAQSYPTKPLRLIIGFPPGSAADILARIMSQWLTERIGQPVIVEAKPGAGGNISVQTALAAPPDGYSLVLVAASNAINATLYGSLPFDLLRDLAPVAGLATFPLAMNVNPTLPVRSVAELEIEQGLADSTVKARIAQVVALPLPLGAEQFGAYVAAETKKWGQVVKLSGAKPE